MGNSQGERSIFSTRSPPASDYTTHSEQALHALVVSNVWIAAKRFTGLLRVAKDVYICIYIYICTYVYIDTYIYIYIYIGDLPSPASLDFLGSSGALSRFGESSKQFLHGPQQGPLSQRVHVGIWYILRAQRGSHIPTLRPKYIPYTYIDPLGMLC